MVADQVVGGSIPPGDALGGLRRALATAFGGVPPEAAESERRMFYTYIIRSLKTGRFYTGSCEGLKERLKRHNAGQVRVTRFGIPWKLVYFEEFTTRQGAYRRERQIKRYKGGQAFKKLISGGIA